MCVAGSDKKEKTSLPHRARAINGKGRGVPSAGVLRFVSSSELLPALKKARAAFDGQGPKGGFEFARVLAGFGARACTRAQWVNKLGAPNESGRVLQNFVYASGSLEEKARKAVFLRRFLARTAQRRYNGLGLKMRATRVSAPGKSGLSEEDWSQCVQVGPWAFELSCKGIFARARSDCEKCPGRKDVRPRPGCADCMRRMLKIVRGITQLARRFEVWGDPECMWLIRASHYSHEIRHPWLRRESVPATGRRIVRGPPHAPKSVDFWPG